MYVRRRTWLIMFAVVALIWLLGHSNPAQADTFYAASGSSGIAGSLYTLDPLTGAATLVGALEDAAGDPYGLTGLAFHPTSGVLYGSTSNASPTARGHLVTVDPATGLVTDIGSFSTISSTLSDITFTPDGTLYGWEAAGLHSLYSIDLLTGVATLVGLSTVGGGFGGGGLAADLAGTIYVTPDSSTNPPGTLRTVDRTTGLDTVVATLSGAPLVTGGGGNVLNALDFNSSGVLYGVNTNQGNPALTHLVTIDFSTGAITDIGAAVDNLDALAILRQPVPEPGTLGLMGLGCAAAFAWAARLRPRTMIDLGGICSLSPPGTPPRRSYLPAHLGCLEKRTRRFSGAEGPSRPMTAGASVAG
jgi:hypothetical protein